MLGQSSSSCRWPGTQVYICCNMLEEWIIGLFHVKNLFCYLCILCVSTGRKWGVTFDSAGECPVWSTSCTDGSCAQAQPLLVLVSYGSQLPAAVLDELSSEAVYTVRCKGSPWYPTIPYIFSQGNLCSYCFKQSTGFWRIVNNILGRDFTLMYSRWLTQNRFVWLYIR